MPLLKVPKLDVIIDTGQLLARKSLNSYYFQYVYRDVVRPLFKKHLKNVQVSCHAKWNSDKLCWEGNLYYQEKSYRWVIR